MPITTVANWKAYRGIASGVTSWDAVVTLLIPSVEAEVERYIGRTLDEQTLTDEPYSGDGSQTLVLDDWPITAITAIKTRSDDGSTTTLAATTYRCLTGAKNRGEIVRLPFTSGTRIYTDDFGVTGVSSCGPVWPEGHGNILVSGTVGYATIPDDIEEAAHCLIDAKLAGRGRNIFDVQVGEGNVTRAARTADDAMARYGMLLRPHRRLP